MTKISKISLINLGTFQGVVIPDELIQKYGLTDSILLEETEQGLLIRKSTENQPSWPETYQAIAHEKEEWSDFDEAILDGLEREDFEP